MNDRTRSAFQVVTVIRGGSVPGAVAGEPHRGLNTATLTAPFSGAPAVPGPASGDTIYGVPVSAVQHCCGRGCKHCRIYWHRMKP